jgi:hypothetical protein
MVQESAAVAGLRARTSMASAAGALVAGDKGRSSGTPADMRWARYRRSPPARWPQGVGGEPSGTQRHAPVVRVSGVRVSWFPHWQAVAAASVPSSLPLVAQFCLSRSNANVLELERRLLAAEVLDGSLAANSNGSGTNGGAWGLAPLVWRGDWKRYSYTYMVKVAGVYLRNASVSDLLDASCGCFVTDLLNDSSAAFVIQSQTNVCCLCVVPQAAVMQLYMGHQSGHSLPHDFKHIPDRQVRQ